MLEMNLAESIVFRFDSFHPVATSVHAEMSPHAYIRVAVDTHSRPFGGLALAAGGLVAQQL